MFKGMVEFLRKHHYTDLGIALVFVHIIDVLVATELSMAGMFDGLTQTIMNVAEWAADAVFVLGLVFGVIAWLVNKELLIRRAFQAYAVIATLNLLDDVASLVIMAETKKGQPLFMLYDVFAIYVMNIVIFSAWYMIVDQTTPGGGFLFPKCENPDGTQKKPIYTDYLFIAFNVSSTFGPTVEAVIARHGKVLMMVQTLISLVIVTVLVARIVSG